MRASPVGIAVRPFSNEVDLPSPVRSASGPPEKKPPPSLACEKKKVSHVKAPQSHPARARTAHIQPPPCHPLSAKGSPEQSARSSASF